MSDSMALMTVESPDAKPGIERAAELLGVKADAIDREFGVVTLDPGRGLYAVQVLSSALAGQDSPAAAESRYQGPFANPRIEAFGPRRR